MRYICIAFCVLQEFMYFRRYVLERYVHVLLGRSHLDISESQRQHTVLQQQPQHVHVTPFELHGLKAIVMYLHSLPSTKKNVPDLIRDPVALIHDVRCLVEQHRHDNAEAAVTGNPVLPPPPPMSIVDRVSIIRYIKSKQTNTFDYVFSHFFLPCLLFSGTHESSEKRFCENT